MKPILLLVMTAVLPISSTAHAQSSSSMDSVISGMPVPECMDPKNRHTPLCKDMEDDMQEMVVIHHASGVVKVIDLVSGTVTLAHGPVESLHWPAMTMPFQVRDKTLFAKLAIAPLARLNSSTRGQVKFPQAGQPDCRLIHALAAISRQRQ